MTRSLHKNRKEHGANLVEMALLVPLLLVLLVGVADLGRAYFTYITMINAAREGARYAVDHSCEHDIIVLRTVAEADYGGVVIQPDYVSVEGLCAHDGAPVTVRIDLPFQVILGGVLGTPTFPIQAHATFAAR